MPAAVQRNAITAFRHRFTLRQTRRTVPIMFSIELVQASERLSFTGKPRRLTVSISSSPSRGWRRHRAPPGQADGRDCATAARGVESAKESNAAIVEITQYLSPQGSLHSDYPT